VECSSVSGRLRIIHHTIFVGLTNFNKHFWRRCQGETVKREILSIANLVPYFSLDFIVFLSSHLLLFLWDHLVTLLSILSCTLKRKLWPLETLDLILTSGHELCLRLVEMIMKQSFLGATDENSSLHLWWTGTEEMKQERAWETICSTFTVDLYPTVHRRSQDHILNRVRNLCIHYPLRVVNLWPHPTNVVRMTIMQYLDITRNWPLEHQFFLQHHVFGCNIWFYSNQRINGSRYLDVMATKNVGCLCRNSRCKRLVLMPRWKWWLPLWVPIATTNCVLR
jgi:hypothetical protein